MYISLGITYILFHCRLRTCKVSLNIDDGITSRQVDVNVNFLTHPFLVIASRSFPSSLGQLFTFTTSKFSSSTSGQFFSILSSLAHSLKLSCFSLLACLIFYATYYFSFTLATGACGCLSPTAVLFYSLQPSLLDLTIPVQHPAPI